MGCLRRARDFTFKGKKSKFVILPSGNVMVDRLAREENVSYSSSEDEVLTNEETCQRRDRYGFLFKQGPGSFTVDSMIHDDFKKLNKHNWSKMTRRERRNIMPGTCCSCHVPLLLFCCANSVVLVL